MARMASFVLYPCESNRCCESGVGLTAFAIFWWWTPIPESHMTGRFIAVTLSLMSIMART